MRRKCKHCTKIFDTKKSKHRGSKKYKGIECVSIVMLQVGDVPIYAKTRVTFLYILEVGTLLDNLRQNRNKCI